MAGGGDRAGATDVVSLQTAMRSWSKTDRAYTRTMSHGLRKTVTIIFVDVTGVDAAGVQSRP